MKQRKKWAKWQQLELRFSQRSNDHTPDINNTDINPNPFEYFPPKALKTDMSPGEWGSYRARQRKKNSEN